MHADDGIVLRLPDADLLGLDLLDADPRSRGTEYDADASPVGAADVVFENDEVEQLVTDQVGGSALFASRFRECAARALLLPRRDPGRRTPLWQQRQRAAQLLQVACEFASFPIVLEAVRECLQDVFDVPGLTELMAGHRLARRPAGRGRRRRNRHRSPAPCCSATSPSSSTRATPPSPNAGPPRCPWTPGCSPSCSARPSCGSCWTPR